MIRMFRRKKLESPPVGGENIERILQWWKPGQTIYIYHIDEKDGQIQWDYSGKHYTVQVQAAPFLNGERLIYNVRDEEPFTFNPYLRTNFDPETYQHFEAISDAWYASKGTKMTEKLYKQLCTSYKVTNGLYGALSKDESEKDMFNAHSESKLMLAVKMLGGIGVLFVIQAILQGVANIF